LVITHGLSGCGKTTTTNGILQNDARAATVRLRSDVERKRLFGLASTDHSGSALDAGIYTADAHARTYEHLRALAADLLGAGWSVIVDAAFLRRAERERVQRLVFLPHKPRWHSCASAFRHARRWGVMRQRPR
jgi:predicted kinase